MTMPWVLRGCRKASFLSGSAKSTPVGSMPRRLYRGQRVLDVGDEEAEVVRARAEAGQETAGEGRAGAPGGCQQLDFRICGEFQLTPPVPGRVAAIGPGSAEDAAD
jgi:hypothetical protein